MAILSLHAETGNASLTDIPPNLTNPICIGTTSQLTAQGTTIDVYLGTNQSYPLPLDQSQTTKSVERWCPWDLQLNPPSKPGDGIYPYPDDNIKRPIFNPCLSACAKYNSPQDCCTGSHDSPNTCSPSLYSKDAKKICPDAYSYGIYSPIQSKEAGHLHVSQRMMTQHQPSPSPQAAVSKFSSVPGVVRPTSSQASIKKSRSWLPPERSVNSRWA